MHPLAVLSVILQDDMRGVGILAGLMAFIWIIALAGYVYFALCLMKIAEKTNTENGWWAWIPVLNILLMLAIARKPMWWILLFLVPLVNFVIAIIVWIEICKARGKSPWILLGFLVPLGGLVVMGYLAFAD